MASWKEERDRLVAQTLAFVQQVAAAHPGAAQKVDIPATVESDTVAEGFAAAAASLPEPSTSGGPDFNGNAEAPPSEPVPISLAEHPVQYSNASERTDIGKRVAAFKARQAQLLRDRETYYDLMQSRIRASLLKDSGTGKL